MLNIPLAPWPSFTKEEADAVSAVTTMFVEREPAAIPHPVPADYGIANTSERVCSLIIGTARPSNSLDGIRANDLL